MDQVIALQSLPDAPRHDPAPENGEIAISELSFAICGPFPSEFSLSVCI
ncbi:hypothetical protein OG896_02520 [Streptomyces sp. NBC_00669]|nr:hypothetical protein [Streptomyces sp. NBC_00669]